MSIHFPYRYKDSPFGHLADPIITVPILTSDGWLNFDFLLDTGADVSMAPKSMAFWTGQNPLKLSKHRSYGIEGKGLVVYHGSLRIRFNKKEIKIPCLFSSLESTPFLLGRAGIFDRFSIVFDNREKRIVLQEL